MNNWNRVLIACSTNSGRTIDLHYIVQADLIVGDLVLCESIKGPLQGKIISVEKCNVKHSDKHKKVKKLDPEEVEQGEEENNMLQSIFKVVKVQHNSSSRENYVYTSLDVVPGDIVVYQANQERSFNPNIEDPNIEGSFRLSVNWHVGIVKEIYSPNSCKKPVNHDAFIVQKINTEQYFRDLATKERAISIKNKLDAKRKEFEQMQIYEMLAAADPSAKALLDEFKQLKADQPEFKL